MAHVYMLKEGIRGTQMLKLNAHRSVLNSMHRAALERYKTIVPGASRTEQYQIVYDALMAEYKRKRKLANVSFYPDTIDYTIWTILNEGISGRDKIRLPDRLFDGISTRTRPRLDTLYGRIITEKPFKSLDPGEHARIEVEQGIGHMWWALVIEAEYDVLDLRKSIFTSDEKTNIAAY